MITVIFFCAVLGQDFNVFDVPIASQPPKIIVKEYSEEFLINIVECEKCQKELVRDGTFTDDEMQVIVKKGKAILAIKSMKKAKEPITIKSKTSTIIQQPIIRSSPVIRRYRWSNNYCPTCPN